MAAFERECARSGNQDRLPRCGDHCSRLLCGRSPSARASCQMPRSRPQRTCPRRPVRDCFACLDTAVLDTLAKAGRRGCSSLLWSPSPPAGVGSSDLAYRIRGLRSTSCARSRPSHYPSPAPLRCYAEDGLLLVGFRICCGRCCCRRCTECIRWILPRATWLARIGCAAGPSPAFLILPSSAPFRRNWDPVGSDD